MFLCIYFITYLSIYLVSICLSTCLFLPVSFPEGSTVDSGKAKPPGERAFNVPLKPFNTTHNSVNTHRDHQQCSPTRSPALSVFHRVYVPPCLCSTVFVILCLCSCYVPPCLCSTMFHRVFVILCLYSYYVPPCQCSTMFHRVFVILCLYLYYVPPCQCSTMFHRVFVILCLCSYYVPPCLCFTESMLILRSTVSLFY